MNRPILKEESGIDLDNSYTINLSEGISIHEIDSENDYLKYETRFVHSKSYNKATMILMFQYINKLIYESKNKENYKESEIYVESLITGDLNYCEYLPEAVPTTYNYGAELVINDEKYMLKMTGYYNGGELYDDLTLSSYNPVNLNPERLIIRLVGEAIKNSSLKGSFFKLKDNTIEWELLTLDPITFNDVYLPDTLMKDLENYIKLYEKKDKLNRLLLSGSPGTGKTESTRAISHLLNKNGVTVIKTNVCKTITEKMQLAELLKPSLVIFDDIDLYLGDRNNGGFSPLMGKFLDVLDGVNKLSPQVGIIATTNAAHLIDLAIQRPGRFNKLLFFDDLTEENINKIILKSLHLLNLEYNNVTEEDRKLLVDKKLIDFFTKSKSTGAKIFESIQEIKNNSDLSGEKINIDEIVKELDERNTILDKKLSENLIRKELNTSNNKKMGYHN